MYITYMYFTIYEKLYEVAAEHKPRCRQSKLNQAAIATLLAMQKKTLTNIIINLTDFLHEIW